MAAQTSGRGWCSRCQMPLLPDQYKMVKGNKICNACLAQEEKVKQAKANDLGKNEFFKYLLSFCPSLSEVPESWYAILEGMLKRNWTVKNIRNTITYCDQEGKKISPENWSQLVYIYYNEAVAWVDKIRELQEKNQQMELTQNVVTVPFRSTSYRDMPKYKMEDL